jgi:hypothetical protein
MLNDESLVYVKGNDSVIGEATALVWVIDGDCLYDIPVWTIFVDMLMNHDEVIDVSEEHPEHDGITVAFIKDGEVIDKLKTSEYFGSILLSEPEVVQLSKYPYGRYVISPDAKFDGEKFIITNRDVSKLPAWHPNNRFAPKDYFENFGNN